MLIGKLNAVSVRYGENVILDEVTADIPEGERIAIVGPNGAGKTTLLSCWRGNSADIRKQFTGTEKRLRYVFSAGTGRGIAGRLGTGGCAYLPEEMECTRKGGVSLCEWRRADEDETFRGTCGTK